MITGMIWFYVQMSVYLHIEYIENVLINIKTILHFVNLWSKGVPLNISYPRMFNNIDGYFDAIFSPGSVIYIIKSEKQMNHKGKTRKKRLGVDYQRV